MQELARLLHVLCLMRAESQRQLQGHDTTLSLLLPRTCLMAVGQTALLPKMTFVFGAK